MIKYITSDEWKLQSHMLREIDRLKEAKRAAQTLPEKLNLDRQIKDLIASRRRFLGLEQ